MNTPTITNYANIGKAIFKFFETVSSHIHQFIQNIKKIFSKPEPSGMQTWAEREVELACKRERAASEGDGDDMWDYGCACYESALRAFQSLIKDGHSGMSIVFTKEILNRLIDNKPLTPIEDTDDIWNNISDISGLEGEEVNYQCKRMSSLFKYVYSDGKIKYRDVNAYIGVDIQDNSTFHSGLIDNFMNKLSPITMPYAPPTKPTKVYCQDFLTDKKNGDFDTRAFLYAIKPDGERIDIDKFFKETEDGWEEISFGEMRQRAEMSGTHLPWIESRLKE